MTAEEQIKEVMSLANNFALRQADARETLLEDSYSEEESEDAYEAAKKARNTLEAKLRNLIKDEG